MPNSEALSSAFLIPPEQWPPRSTPPTLPQPGADASLAMPRIRLNRPVDISAASDPRCKAGGLVLQLALRHPWQRLERLEHHPFALLPPEAGDGAVDEERLLDVAVLVDH